MIYEVEADTYYCFSKVLDGILDNYTDKTPGINKSIIIIKSLIQSVDKKLFIHLNQEGEKHSTDLIHFASFKWLSCLLIREFPLNLSMRLFDTYISDDEGFSNFHTHICATLFLIWANKLKSMNFMDLMVFL
jgi:hypothetical protein